MANPPANRRPGVDADIFQGQWVRGFDVPAGNSDPAADPCDLIISNGKSQIDQTVANLIFANRTDDIGQPIFVMLLGEDPTGPTITPPISVGVHIGAEADPNGLITASRPGSLYLSSGTPSLWQVQSDGNTWVKVSDDLGGEDLQQTLALGNTTSGFNILLTNGDFLKGEDSAVGDGASANIAGGNATGIAGDGGKVLLQGGTSVGGATGAVEINTPIATSTGGSGQFSFITGDSKLGAPSGGINLGTGEAGDVGFSGSGGEISVFGGRSRSSGVGAEFGGGVFLTGGQATSSGQGGGIRLQAGVSSDVDTPILPSAPISGQGGFVSLTAGASSSNRVGGAVSLTGGTGGSAGATGGSILLNPGNGGGGFAKGEIVGDGIFRSDNIQRGIADPNSVSLSGDEGDVYQRTDGGVGQVWVNTNGTATGWKQLAFAGNFVEAFQQMQYGYVSPAMSDFGGTDADKYSDIGLFKGFRATTAGAPIIQQGVSRSGPVFQMLCNESTGGETASLELVNGGGRGIQTRSRYFATFAFYTASTNDNACRYFVGFTDNDPGVQLAQDLPPFGNYLGFLRSNISANWVIVTRGPSGANFLDTGIAKSTIDAPPSGIDAYYFVIDATDADVALTGVVRFFILDPELNVISSVTVPLNLPNTSNELWPLIGLRTQNVSALAFSSLNLISASVTTKGDTVGQGAGTGGGLLSLSQVLINGNETAATLIRVNQGGGLLGVTDDAAGDGASFGVFGGATTLATNDTGTLSLGSGNAFGGGAENPGSTTGSLLLSTGFQFGAASMGDTGIARIQTGDHLGPDGTTGDIVLRTGGFFNGAAGVRTQGDILIAPGSFTPNTATVTGEVILKGGSSSLTGVTGGDVTIMSGENSSATGDTGDILVETFSANLSGNSGGLELKTGDAGTVSGDSGNLNIETGDGIAGNTGAIAITTGDAGNGAGGAILIAPGSTTSGVGASVLITGGTTADAGALGGNIVLTPGGGGLGSGEVTINGKLTVTGIIDPPALIMSGSLVAPAALPAAGGEGMLWVDDTVVPSRLIFTNDNNVNTDISTGGGATTLGALTDVTVAAPAVGEVLTLNGALQWVNAAGAGGSPLATILAIGNTTGALPIVVEDSLGARLTSDGNLLLDPSATPGDAVVLDGLRWPEADGAAGFVLTTNGLGQLSFQAGGGGGGSGISFGEAFTRMQWGTVQAATAAPFWGTDGIFTTPIAVTSTSPISGLSNTEGYSFSFDTPAAPLGIGGVEIEVGGSGFGLQARPIISIKFNGPSLDTSVRFFVGLTDAANITAQTGSVAPAQRYVGIQIYTDVPQTTLHFVTDDNTGTPTTFNTGVSALGVGFELVLDATVPGTVTLTLYDNTGAQLSTTSFAANLPLATAILGLQISAMTLNGASKVMSLYGANVVTRGDLLNAVGGGGGGNQDLASVLGFGNETNGTAVKGSDNAAGSGSSLDLLGGASTGGAGVGGAVNVITGAPDPGGVGAGGALVLTTATGAGVGDGGILSVTTGDGGVGGGDGGNFSVTLGAGPGAASGDGGSYLLAAGDGGGTGGVGGLLSLQAGSALAGNDAGGPVSLTSGDGFGTGNGGLFTFDAGDGGAGGGDGGSFLFTAGTGNGGGIDGTITFTGDTTITGKLTVTGLIDPTGLLLDSQGAVPFIPLGSDGGIWVNAASELIFTNSGGDLNLSTAIGGGLTFLDALLTAGYGFLGPGNSIGGPQSYGVFGSSVNSAVSPGPPPASITVGQDSDGPFANLAVAADAGGSEAFLGTSELQIQRDSQFKARFKFQITSPAHTDERLFIGYTDDATQVSPNPQLAVDHPVPGLQYMALVQNFAGFNLEFVAQGSGGAMVAVFAIPTDALVHYFEIDASATTGDVTFTVYAADGITVQATHTELASFLIPDLANPLRPLVGITNGTSTTTPRSIDFYDATVVTRADVVDAVTGGGGAGGTSPLSAVLAAGNTTGGLPILVASSVDGDGVDLLLNGGAAGGAADVAHLTLESESGDDGGDAILVAGDGAGAAGNGGELRIGGRDGVGTGDGGDTLVTAGSADTGIAGDIQLSAGDATGLTGTGGAIQLSGGDSFGTMDGGAVTLIGGDGGVGPGTGDGGNVELLAGTSGGAGGEGKIRLFAGSASPLPVLITLDSIQVVSSPYLADPLSSSSALFTRGTVGKGGDVQFKAGSGAAGSGGIGGDIELRTGGGDGGADGGRILILGGGAAVASSLSPGGDVQMVGGADSGNAMGALIHADGGSPLFGGVATVQGGAAIIASGLDGGAVNVTGGAGDGVAEGGAVNIVGGEGGATGTGGTVQIRGGEATGGANTGGDVQLIGGAGPAGDGVISIEGRLNNFASGFQFGSPAIPGVGTFVIGFNSVFPTIPRLVQVSIEATVAAVGGAANGFNIMVAPGSITAVGFTLDAVAIGAVPGPITVNWVAYA